MLKPPTSAVKVGFRHISILKHLICSNKCSFQLCPSILSVHHLHKNYFRAFSLQKDPDHLKTSIQGHRENFTVSESSKVNMDTLIGPDISNFTRRAEQRLPIIDKTGQILDLITKGSTAFVMGPRRFGKTLDLTTVEAIFTRGPKWWENHCKDLKIVKDHKYSFPVHPVLKLDFSKKADHLTLKMDIALQLMKLIEELELNWKLDWEIRTYQEDYTSDATFFTLFKSAMLEISRKSQTGVVVLIDEYDSPFITLAEDILQKSPYSRDLTNNPEMSALIKFMSRFFALIKELRATEIDGRVCVGFEYLTGAVPISQLGLFSGANDVYVVRRDPIYYDIIGYTEEEILTTFSPHINNAASKLLLASKTKKTQEDLPLQDENSMLEKIKHQIKQDIRLNYNGFRFRHDQPNALYSPFGINSLFGSWSRGSDITYPAFFSQSGSSTLLWRAVKIMPLKTVRNFLWALIGELDSVPIFECAPDDLQVNQTLEELFFDPMRLGFFSGVFSIDLEKSTAESWKLIITNNEMRRALLAELTKILKLQNRIDNILNTLLNENYPGYFNLINQELANMSAIVPSSNQAVKSEHEIEAYGHSLFVFLHSQIKEFNQKKTVEDQDKVKYFYFDANKEISYSSKRRPDFLLRFNITISGSETKKILWIVEFKCKENIALALQEAKKDLEAKLSDLSTLKQRFKEHEFEECEKIFIAGALGFGKIQSVILYKQNNEKQLEEFLSWSDAEHNLKK